MNDIKPGDNFRSQVLFGLAENSREYRTEYVGPRKDHLLQFLFTPRGRTQAGNDLCLAKAIIFHAMEQ